MGPRFLDDERKFILVREGDDRHLSERSLGAWCSRHRNDLVQMLDHHGGILFRGSMAADADALGRFAADAGFTPGDYLGGSTPRTQVRGDVYTSTDLSPLFPIPVHNEMSYLARYPRFLLFFCVQPARRAGWTPLADMGRVYARLLAALRDRFDRLGLCYTFRLSSRHPNAAAKTWQGSLGTVSLDEACEIARRRGLEPVWDDRSGVLTLTSRRPATLRHPRTQVPVWFNQAHVYHESYADELAHHGRPVLAWVVRQVNARQQYVPSRFRTGYTVTFGDGSPISREEIRTLREALWAETVTFDWQPGDLLLLDNLRAAHGRTPFSGKRRILTYLGDDWPGTEAAPVLDQAPAWPRSEEVRTPDIAH